MLHDLIKLGSRPRYLTTLAYLWCSKILEHHQSSEDRDNLLLLSLKTGFRHLGQDSSTDHFGLAHTEHHRGFFDVIVKSNDGEAIADLLHAWTTSRCPFLGTCAEHLVGLRDRVSFSPRLHRVAVRSVELIGYKGFEGVGMERFCQFLDHLYVTAGDVGEKRRWIELLLGCLQSPEGIQHLTYRCWELLVEIVARRWELQSSDSVSNPQITEPPGPIYNPQITVFLAEAQEWDKLECWMASVWMMWPPGNLTTEGDLERSTLLLFHQRPDAARKLTLWMERWGKEHRKEVSESFKRICQQATEVMREDPM